MSRTALEHALGDNRVVIVPVGATEQHGPHLPPGVDALLAETVALEAAGRIDSALVAPTLSLGVSQHHAGFPGTLWLRPNTLRAIVLDIAASLASAGIPRILFLNGHGGNTATLQEAVYEWGATSPEASTHGVFTANYWSLANLPHAELNPWGPETTGHAGAIETSLMLHLFPDLVEAHLTADPTRGPAYSGFASDLLEASSVNSWVDFADISSNGVLGTPSLATANHGQRVFESCVEGLIRWVEAEARNRGRN